MPKSFSSLPKKLPAIQPSKAIGPGAFGPVIAPKPIAKPQFGSIMGPKTTIPKEPKITRKPPKLIKQAPPSYL